MTWATTYRFLAFGAAVSAIGSALHQPVIHPEREICFHLIILISAFAPTCVSAGDVNERRLPQPDGQRANWLGWTRVELVSASWVTGRRYRRGFWRRQRSWTESARRGQQSLERWPAPCCRRWCCVPLRVANCSSGRSRGRGGWGGPREGSSHSDLSLRHSGARPGRVRTCAPLAECGPSVELRNLTSSVRVTCSIRRGGSRHVSALLAARICRPLVSPFVV